MGATARVMIINYVVAENMHALLMSEHNCLIQSEQKSAHHFVRSNAVAHFVYNNNACTE